MRLSLVIDIDKIILLLRGSYILFLLKSFLKMLKIKRFAIELQVNLYIMNIL